MTMGVIEDRTATLNKTGSLVAALTQFMRITTEVAVPHIYILPSDGVFFFQINMSVGRKQAKRRVLPMLCRSKHKHAGSCGLCIHYRATFLKTDVESTLAGHRNLTSVRVGSIHGD